MKLYGRKNLNQEKMRGQRTTMTSSFKEKTGLMALVLMLKGKTGLIALVFMIGSMLIPVKAALYAQPAPPALHQAQQVPGRLISLILKKDICTLLDHYSLPITPGPEKRPFLRPPTPARTQMRLDLDSLLREYIDCLRELMLAFHRLSISEKSPVTSTVTLRSDPNSFLLEIEIEAPQAHPRAVTISPSLAAKNLSLSFQATITCSDDRRWEVITISRPGFHLKNALTPTLSHRARE
jgi:hypothetical protein